MGRQRLTGYRGLLNDAELPPKPKRKLKDYDRFELLFDDNSCIINARI